MFKLSKTLGNVLLVGEGNFSFSFSLLRKYESFNAKNLFATSYESKDDCLKKYGNADVSKNIGFLEVNGAKVLHGIDAIDLPKELTYLKFDLMIFQFPHTGRKASIKQNRELLKNFFYCAKQCLSHNGSVIVTLCAGQGGTPADIVQREHCNSWQIVEMAASGDFILTDVQTFESADFPGYVSTGRRNHGNSFITRKAMSHKFKLGEKTLCTPEWQRFAEQSYTEGPPYALQKRIQLLEENAGTFPHSWISKEIAMKLGYTEHFTSKILTNWASQRMKRLPFAEPDRCNSEFLDYAFETFLQRTPRSDGGMVCHGISSCAPKLTNTIPSIFQYAMLLMTYSAPDELVSKVSNILCSFCDRDLVMVRKKILCNSKGMFKKVQNSNGITIIENTMQDIFVLPNSRKETPVGLSFEVCINKEQLNVLMLDVQDVILSLNSSFCDQRLFWSLNRLTRTKVIESLKNSTRYLPKSLYPPKYTHDFSFWIENNQDPLKLPFCKENLITMLFWTIDDVIASLECVDEYLTAGRKSSCYRVVYQSHDDALSREDSLRLQSYVQRDDSVNITNYKALLETIYRIQ